jgi:hypothetical protein
VCGNIFGPGEREGEDEDWMGMEMEMGSLQVDNLAFLVLHRCKVVVGVGVSEMFWNM